MLTSRRGLGSLVRLFVCSLPVGRERRSDVPDGVRSSSSVRERTFDAIMAIRRTVGTAARLERALRCFSLDATPLVRDVVCVTFWVFTVGPLLGRSVSDGPAQTRGSAPL